MNGSMHRVCERCHLAKQAAAPRDSVERAIVAIVIVLAGLMAIRIVASFFV